MLATGSAPFVPPVPGVDKKGVFVYRTIEDLERIIAYAGKATRAAVIGGGLLGLEAAKAVRDLGLETHVVEFAPRLMPRQVDDAGSRTLVDKIEALGVRVHLDKSTKEILGNGKVEGMEFADGGQLDVDMVVISAGIRPRDELARACGLEVGPRGGVVVDDRLRTSRPGHLRHRRGRLAPGHDLRPGRPRLRNGRGRRGEPRPAASATFTGADMSTKLKLMGVDVASFGDPFAEADGAEALTYEDPFGGVYKKLLFNRDGTRLLGGILVGDASDYGTLLGPVQERQAAAGRPRRAAAGLRGERRRGLRRRATTPRSARATTSARGRSATRSAIKELTTVAAGQDVHQGRHRLRRLPAAGHRPAQGRAQGGRQEGRQPPLRALPAQPPGAVRDRQDQADQDVRRPDRRARPGHGCEICKPAVASILASLWNENVLDPAHATLQDTNDRFLANIQRGGLYSVVPRVPGGEITPEKLIVLGEVARKYGLYTKITGGQRIDLFGAPVHQLPDIWEELVDAGFESGHAYGKALRTVKSCVGSTWCRYGVQDSVGFADPGRDALPRAPGAAQAQGGRLRLRPRVCRGPEQGLRPDRHREGLQPLRLRQRRRQAAARRPARRRPRRGDRHPVSSIASSCTTSRRPTG